MAEGCHNGVLTLEEQAELFAQQLVFADHEGMALAKTTAAAAHEDNIANSFLNLPYELKASIITKLPHRLDLLNLTLTCQELESATRAFLHRLLVLNVQGERVCEAERLPSIVSTPKILDQIRNIVIQPSGEAPLWEGCGRAVALTKSRQFEDGLMDLLSRIPRNQLISFKYKLRTPASQAVMESLFDYHSASLTTVEFFNIEPYWRPILGSTPSGLQHLHYYTIGDGASVACHVSQNRASIKSLHLGNGYSILESPYRSRTTFVDQPPSVLGEFCQDVSLLDLPHLGTLELVRINVAPIVTDLVQYFPFPKPESFSVGIQQILSSLSSTWLHNIKRLVLESCWGSAELLSCMATVFRSFRDTRCFDVFPFPVQLKHFIFRCELLSPQLIASLMDFLHSFDGLETLSILLEGPIAPVNIEDLICGHGPTLRKLSLECRLSPRLTLPNNTTRPIGSGDTMAAIWQRSFEDIAKQCPNLIELGTGCPWDEPECMTTNSTINTLKSLQTVHLRNFPTKNASNVTPISVFVKESATKWMEATFPVLSSPSGSSEQPPALSLLAIGPALYHNHHGFQYPSLESSFRGPPSQETTPAKSYQCMTFFAVDWARNRFGEWKPLLTEVPKRYVKELRDGEAGKKPLGTGEREGLGGVFEAVWMK